MDQRLTNIENQALTYMAEEAMDACGAQTLTEAENDYCAPVSITEIARTCTISNEQARGVMSSLIKKDLVMHDDEGEPGAAGYVYWLTTEGFSAAGDLYD